MPFSIPTTPKKSFARWLKDNAELVISIAAVVVAIGALRVSCTQVEVSRETARHNNELSVMPAVNIWNDNYQGMPRWIIASVGQGPAIIAASQVRYRNNKVKVEEGEGISWRTWKEVKKKFRDDVSVLISDGKICIEPKDKTPDDSSIPEAALEIGGFECGDVFPKDDVMVLLKLTDNSFGCVSNEMRKFINLEICYCSFAGNCYHAIPTEPDKVTDVRLNCPSFVDVEKLRSSTTRADYCKKLLEWSVVPRP